MPKKPGEPWTIADPITGGLLEDTVCVFSDHGQLVTSAYASTKLEPFHASAIWSRLEPGSPVTSGAAASRTVPSLSIVAPLTVVPSGSYCVHATR